jgi:DNA replication factor GINS
METGGKVISELFMQREREFLLSPVRVMVKASFDGMEVGDVEIGKMKQGEAVELPRWVAEELAELNIAEIQEEGFEGEIFKALTREKMLGAPQLSPLQANFYLRMRRRLATIKAGSEIGKYRREDYEKLKSTCYDLIGRRLSKLLSMSSSASLQTVGDKITPEERVFFTTSRSFSDEWKGALLGES